MAVRSRDFVGIAEGIKSHELSTKGKIESLKGTISELSSRKSALDNQISYLEAALSAAYEDTDEDGDPDYGRISAIESQINAVEGELSGVESQLDGAQGELSQSKAELESVMEEKAQTLFEIQERARKTSQNISVAGGMYGAYSGVGGSLQGSLQASLSSLSQAASILDGSVDSAGGGGSSSSGDSSGPGRTSSGDLSTGALSAFAGGANPATASLSEGGTGVSAPSDFSTNHTGEVTPATTPNFHSGQKSINPQKTLNFSSDQSGNTYATSSFSESGDDGEESKAANFSSSQASPAMEARFQKNSSGDDGNSGSPRGDLEKRRAWAQQYQVGFTPIASSNPNSGSGSGSSAPDRGQRELDDELEHAFTLGSLFSENDSSMSSVQLSQLGKQFNLSWPWGRSVKHNSISKFCGLSVEKNSLLGDRYFVKGNNYDLYCEYRKNISLYTHINCNESKIISAKDIEGIYLNDNEVNDAYLFWNRNIEYEVSSEKFFSNIASYIPEIQTRIKNGESLVSIQNDPQLSTCYEFYFQKPIEVYEIDGFYEFAGSGRHRCMAAQKLGLDIPVRLVARYERKESTQSSPPRNIFTDSRQYGYIVDKLTMSNVKYHPIRRNIVSRSTSDIVNRISGGDLTQGSCSSLALAYAGNKAGYDVLDFRDGMSREIFSSRKTIQEIANLPNVNSSVVYEKNDIESAKTLLRKVTKDKEYYFAIGQHAAIIRKHDDSFEYLELQHPSTKNGWHVLDANALIARFGCRKERVQESSSYLIEVESLSNNKEFLNILGYINTASGEQRKGERGNVK